MRAAGLERFAVAGAQLVQVSGGHASIFEDPQQTADALVAFLKELG